MAHIDDRTGLEELDDTECLLLLGRHTVGRLAVVQDGRPAVFPVSYRRDGGTIVFRSDEGTKLDAIARNGDVAFEIDHLEPRTRSGWSVAVTGRAAEITDPLELAAVERLHIEPWAPGAKPRYVRIVPETIGGRRIVRVLAAGPGPEGGGGARRAG
jgi:nitroimidazol reductase NimA-like FMN-containing flavoprotein (pyridoxamine 5'-phosphate oxidase superfamily)